MSDYLVAGTIENTNDLLVDLLEELKAIRQEIHELRIDTYRATGTMHPDVARERVEGGD